MNRLPDEVFVGPTTGSPSTKTTASRIKTRRWERSTSFHLRPAASEMRTPVVAKKRHSGAHLRRLLDTCPTNVRRSLTDQKSRSFGCHLGFAMFVIGFDVNT